MLRTDLKYRCMSFMDTTTAHTIRLLTTDLFGVLNQETRGRVRACLYRMLRVGQAALTLNDRGRNAYHLTAKGLSCFVAWAACHDLPAPAWKADTDLQAKHPVSASCSGQTGTDADSGQTPATGTA